MPTTTMKVHRPDLRQDSEGPDAHTGVLDQNTGGHPGDRPGLGQADLLAPLEHVLFVGLVLDVAGIDQPQQSGEEETEKQKRRPAATGDDPVRDCHQSCSEAVIGPVSTGSSGDSHSGDVESVESNVGRNLAISDKYLIPAEPTIGE